MSWGTAGLVNGYTNACVAVNPDGVSGGYGCSGMGQYAGGQAERWRVPFAGRRAGPERLAILLSLTMSTIRDISSSLWQTGSGPKNPEDERHGQLRAD